MCEALNTTVQLFLKADFWVHLFLPFGYTFGIRLVACKYSIPVYMHIQNLHLFLQFIINHLKYVMQDAIN